MKIFQYPLEKLKQVRQFEMEAAAEVAQNLQRQMTQLRQLIAAKVHQTANAQHALSAAERKHGLQPDMRRMTTLYVTQLQAEQQEFENQFEQLKVAYEAAHVDLIEKKQNLKMLEKHEQRLADEFNLEQQKNLQKQSDDLWLSRLNVNKLAEGAK